MTYSSPNVKFTGFGSGEGSSLERFDQSLDTQGSDAGNADQATTTGQTGSSFGANFGSTGPDWGWLARFDQSDYLDLASKRLSNTSSQASDASSATNSGGASNTSADTTQVVSSAGSNLVFDNTYDDDCSAAFIACIVAAEEQFESLFTNKVTINVTFSMTDDGNSGDVATNSSHGILVSYSKLRAAILADAPGDVLPTTDPSGGGNWYVPYSYARMLGLTSTVGSPDLSVNLNTFYISDMGQDAINAMTHELSEGGLGRIGALGGSGTGYWSAMDLFRYNSSGAADYSNGRDGDTTYFSSNGGSTLSDTNIPGKGAPTLSYNNQYNSSGTKTNGGDTADWVQNSVFGSTGGGETLTLTQTELEVMEALGWKLNLKQDVYEEALGGWETASNWSTGSMPITPQDAYVGGVSGDMIVTLNSNVQVNSIATSADAEFAIGNSTASTLDAIYGTVLNAEDSSSVASGNLGKLGVEAGSALQIGATFDNAGTLAIGKGAGGTGSTADLYIYDTFGATTLDGGGTVDLGQLANPGDDEIQLRGDILNAPGTSGNGLINVDDTITGGGLISLGSFDNQASGAVDASQTGGFWLQVSATTFSNEGFMVAEDGSTLDLGADGVSETLTNTGNGATSGAVNIDSDARLAISGNFTITGSGSVSFKGAGAELTSDGAAATFTNDATVGLAPSLDSSGAFSGQLGDQGLLSSNELTFVNNGTTYASGSGGYTLTINTGANVVTNGANGTLAAENGGLLKIVSNLSNAGIVDVGTSSSSSVGATSGTVDLGSDGASGSLTNTGAVAIYANSDLAISGNYTISGDGGIYLKGAGSDITSDDAGATTLTNDSDIIAMGSGQIGDQGVMASNDLTLINAGEIGATGSGVTLTLNTGANVINDGGGLLAGEDDAILIIDSNVHTGQSSSGSPPGGTVEAFNGGVVELSATISDGVSGPSVKGQVVIDGGTFEMLAGSAVNVPIEFTGGGTLEILRNNATVSVSGSNGAITGKSGDVIAYTSGTGLTVTGKGVTVDASAGTGLTIGANTTAGPQDVVNGSSVTVTVSANSDVAVDGSNDTIKMLGGKASKLTLDGSTNSVTAAKGDTVYVSTGTGDTVNGTGATITNGGSTGVTIKGIGNTVVAAIGDSLTDSGKTTEFQIGSNVGTLTILTFKHDPTGVIDLLNGVGNYATPAAAYAALTTDHAGGSMLSLGVDGTIDFKGDPVADLSASNFKIG